MDKKDITVLIKHFKELARADVLGITVSDARHTVTNWLIDIGREDLAKQFENGVYKYQSSKELEKIWNDYENKNNY